MSNISKKKKKKKIQADKGMTGGVSYFKTAYWSKSFVCKLIFSVTSYSVETQGDLCANEGIGKD